MRRRYNSYKPLSVRRLERKSKNKLLVTLVISGILIYGLIFHLLPTFIGGLSFFNKSTASKVENISDSILLAPPVLNIPYEATNSASIKINGYSSPNSEVEIFLDGRSVSKIETLKDGNFTSDDIELSFGTNNFYGQTIDDKGKRSLHSKTIKIFFDNEKPKLEIREPQDEKVIEGGEKKVKIEGSTDSNEQIIILASGIRLIVSQDGNFSQTIDINEGENNIEITASDIAGNKTIITRRVTYKPQS